jgi:hypothetical protein
MMQEAPMIPMTIGLLKRIEDSMLKVRIFFVAVFKEKNFNDRESTWSISWFAYE